MICATSPTAHLAAPLVARDGGGEVAPRFPVGAAERLADALQGLHASRSLGTAGVRPIEEDVRRARETITGLIAVGAVPASLRIRRDEPLPVVERTLLAAWRHLVRAAPA